MAHELRLHYARWKALPLRPAGMGAFHDFVAVAAERVRAQAYRAIRPGLSAERGTLHADAEQMARWYGEGGNTQTPIQRREPRDADR